MINNSLDNCLKNIYFNSSSEMPIYPEFRVAKICQKNFKNANMIDFINSIFWVF